MFCTECTKVGGTLQYDLQHLHHLTSMIENSFKSDFLHSTMSTTTRTVHLSNNFLRLTKCDSIICIYLKCIRFLSIHQILYRMVFNTDILYSPHCFLFVQHHLTLSSVREPSATLKRSTFFGNKNSIFSHQ